GDEISYAAITRQTPTYSFPSAAGQSAPSVSTGLSRASVRLPRCHFRSTRTCFAMPAGSSSRTMGMTPRPSRAQDHSAHGQVHRHGARPVQGLLERLLRLATGTNRRVRMLRQSIAALAPELLKFRRGRQYRGITLAFSACVASIF